MQASVKIMLSYDYNHFEVCLSSDSEMDDMAVNELRKTAQRLADEAVRQYKVAKKKAELALRLEAERKYLKEEVNSFSLMPESELTAEQRAKRKALEDEAYWNQAEYDYDDDWGLT